MDAAERLRVRVVVGVADVDLVPLGQDRAEPDPVEPRLGAEQVVEDLLPEPFAPLHRARQLLVVGASRDAGQVGRELLKGHVAAFSLEPQVERPDDGEHHQQAGGDREDQPAAPAGGQVGERHGGRAERRQEAAAALRGRHQESEHPQDRQPCVADPRSVSLDQPVDPEPQEGEPDPEVDRDVVEPERVDRRAGAGDADPGEAVHLGQDEGERRPQEVPGQDQPVPAEQARDEGRLAQRGGGDQEGEDAVVPDRGVAYGVELVHGQVADQPDAADRHEEGQHLEHRSGCHQPAPGRPDLEDLDDADPEHDLPDEQRRPGDVDVGEGLAEEQVAAQQQPQRGSEPDEVARPGRRGRPGRREPAGPVVRVDHRPGQGRWARVRSTSRHPKLSPPDRPPASVDRFRSIASTTSFILPVLSWRSVIRMY